LIEYGLDLNLFPLNDKHVNKQLKKYYDVDECDIEDFVEKWSPYKSIAFWYLWKNDINK
jgi:3-methyladenine DNA glycosylase/8-oxoguanine DNA glycosylase